MAWASKERVKAWVEEKPRFRYLMPRIVFVAAYSDGFYGYEYGQSGEGEFPAAYADGYAAGALDREPKR